MLYVVTAVNNIKYYFLKASSNISYIENIETYVRLPLLYRLPLLAKPYSYRLFVHN